MPKTLKAPADREPLIRAGPGRACAHFHALRALIACGRPQKVLGLANKAERERYADREVYVEPH